MAIIGLVMSIVATLLMGDWQAIRHDPCTDHSLFHHPQLLHKYTSQLTTLPEEAKSSSYAIDSSLQQCEKLNLSLSLDQYLSSMDMYVFSNGVTKTGNTLPGCESVESCPECSEYSDMQRTYTAEPTCLHLKMDPQTQCLESARSPATATVLQSELTQVSYSCTRFKSPFTTCITVLPALPGSAVYDIMEEYVADIHMKSTDIIEGRVDLLAQRSCEEHRSCRWNPESVVFHRHCEDCPSICRDKTNYLEFSQFAIGAALLLVAVPVARIPITSLISDIVSGEEQVCVWANISMNVRSFFLQSVILSTS